jgi:RND family efflux transporter MFP subunit
MGTLNPPAPARLSPSLPALFLGLALLSFFPLPTLHAVEPVKLKGLIIPFEEVKLSTRAKGVIQKIHAEGSVVKSGDILMQLENTLERLNVEQQEKILEKRHADADSFSKLLAQEVASRDEELSARVNYDLAKLQLKQAEEMLDKTLLRAPFSGVITKRLRSRGEAVDEFFPVLVLVNLEQVYLESYLPAKLSGTLSKDQEIEIELPDSDGKILRGRVKFISPVVDPASNESRFKILIDNSDGLLRPGTPALVRLPALATATASTP